MAVAEVSANGLSRAEREAMLLQVEGLVKDEVRRAKVPKRHREDVQQDGRMLVWQVSGKFDPRAG